MEAIPRETAWQLCQEIRQENRGKWYTINGLWCWGCATFSRGNPEKMCFAGKAGNRGCGQANARYVAIKERDPDLVVAAVKERDPDPEVAEVEPMSLFGRRAAQQEAQGWRTCAGCGRRFRATAGAQGAESEYCPTCDYRRARQRLDELDRENGPQSGAD